MATTKGTSDVPSPTALRLWRHHFPALPRLRNQHIAHIFKVNINQMLKWTMNVIFKHKLNVFFNYILITICFNPDVYTFCTSALLWAHSAKMASGGVSVASLWTEVNRCGQNGDFTRALKALTKSKNGYLLSSLSIGLKAAVKHPIFPGFC